MPLIQNCGIHCRHAGSCLLRPGSQPPYPSTLIKDMVCLCVSSGLVCVDLWCEVYRRYYTTVTTDGGGFIDFAASARSSRSAAARINETWQKSSALLQRSGTRESTRQMIGYTVLGSQLPVFLWRSRRESEVIFHFTG